MAASGRNRKWNKGGSGRRNDKSENKTDEEEIEKSPVLKAFLQYRNELDAKHDKYERLVKLSRDITIESKRIIFLLLSNTRESADDSKLTEAKSRIMKLITTVFFNISTELDGEDYYQFTRSYCPGVQEFVEAYTFYYYLKFGKLLQWEDIQNDMIYKNEPNMDDVTPDDDVKTSDTNDEVKREDVSDLVTKVNSPDKSENVNISDNKVGSDLKKVLLTPIDYVLGVEDLTGELMRYCINSLATDNINAVHRTCNFVRSIHSGLTFINRIPSKEFYRKMTVLKESLYKIENTCYMLRIRGTEVPKHMLADFISCQDGNDHFDEDEGFY